MSPVIQQTAAAFTPREVEAARRVIIELWQVLGAFRGAMVLVGGWVPELLLPGARPPHTGSLDVDVLLNPAPLREARYADLLRLLGGRGYVATEQPFKFRRLVGVEGGESVPVDVDFLVPRGAKKGPRRRAAPEFRAIDADGGALALATFEPVSLDGTMPEGGRNRVEVGVASVEAFLVMKAYALANRLKEKDAYDIVFCLRNWPGGPGAVADRLRPHLGEPEVGPAVDILAEKFRSVEDLGPRAVVSFEAPADLDEQAFRARDALERVQELLKLLRGE